MVATLFIGGVDMKLIQVKDAASDPVCGPYKLLRSR